MHDWEMDFVSSFFELFYSLILRQGDEDRICWIPFKRRKFEVRLYYHVVSILNSSSFPWKSIWTVKAPFEGDVLCVDNGIRENIDFG